MKKFIFLLILFLFSPVVTYAYPGQYPWDPLHVEVQQDPFDQMANTAEAKRKENQATENRLKSTYGLSQFYSCYSCASMDTSNPYNEATCLIQIEYCLEKKQLEKEKQNQGCTKNIFGECIEDAGCKNKYGDHSYYRGFLDENEKYSCGCEEGYTWNNNKDECIIDTSVTCKLNTVYLRGSNNLRDFNNDDVWPPCTCPDGYFWRTDSNGCVLNETKNQDKNQLCKNSYGNNSDWTGEINEKGAVMCGCKDGYKWNDNQTACIEGGIVKGVSNLISDSNAKEKIIDEEKSLITKIDNNLSKRVSGNILLQVESKGEGWYVNPDNKKKYYLGRPADAFSIMKNLGLGIKRGELANYLNTKFPSRLSGKIMLDVERNGEAYYINPKDLKGYFLNRPADAFRVMRDLGLGITNNDIRKIDVGEIK